MNILSIGIKFQSNSVNDRRVIAGGISTTFLPVKYSRVVVASLYCGVGFLLYMAALRLTTVSLDSKGVERESTNQCLRSEHNVQRNSMPSWNKRPGDMPPVCAKKTIWLKTFALKVYISRASVNALCGFKGKEHTISSPKMSSSPF